MCGGGRGGVEGKDTHKSSGFLWVSIVCYTSIVLLKYTDQEKKDYKGNDSIFLFIQFLHEL